MTPRKLIKIQSDCPIEMVSPLRSIEVKVTRIELKPTIAMQGPVTPNSIALKSKISADIPKRAIDPLISVDSIVILFRK